MTAGRREKLAAAPQLNFGSGLNSMSKTFFISTSIPYVNAEPHIGFALELVQADVLARHHRVLKDDVFFLSGTDDNALKNAQAAEAAGVPVKDWVDRHAAVFQKLAAGLNVSNNDFIRTSSDPRHPRGAEKLWSACKPEDIYKKQYSGLYCVGCEEFKMEKELIDGECPEHKGKKLEIVEEENYFFRLSSYQKQIEDLLESGKLRIIPESRKNEALSFVKSGLEDFSISRSVARAKNWGVPVPGDKSQIMYVWFDALSNYINALGFAENSANFKKYWENGDEILHVIGKGINRFHSVYWPAMLLSAGIGLPKTIFIHGYVTLAGEKISKTLGNVVDPFGLISKYGADTVRYYLLREIAAYGDGDFTVGKFEERYNSDLANGIGNLVSRVFTLVAKRGSLPADIAGDVTEATADAIVAAREGVYGALREFRFNDALVSVWNLISFTDKYVNDRKPWSEADNRKTLFNAVVLIDNIAALLASFLPVTSAKITSAIQWTDGKTLGIKKIENLFPRID